MPPTGDLARPVPWPGIELATLHFAGLSHTSQEGFQKFYFKIKRIVTKHSSKMVNVVSVAIKFFTEKNSTHMRKHQRQPLTLCIVAGLGPAPATGGREASFGRDLSSDHCHRRSWLGLEGLGSKLQSLGPGEGWWLETAAARNAGSGEHVE